MATNDEIEGARIEWDACFKKACSENYSIPTEPGDDEMPLARAIINRALQLMDPELREIFMRDYDLSDELSNDSLFNAWYELDEDERAKLNWVIA